MTEDYSEADAVDPRVIDMINKVKAHKKNNKVEEKVDVIDLEKIARRGI